LAPAPTPTTLSHPDLHLDNIFVHPESKKITSIIDWQTALVSEPYFQQSYPQMLTPVESPSEDDNKDEEDATELNSDMNDFLKRLPRLTTHYQTLTEQRSPQRWALMHDPNHYFLTKVVSSIPGSWKRDSGFGLCHDLVAATIDWEKVAPSGIPCPLHFTDEEIKCHNRDLQVVTDLARVLEQLEQGGIIPNSGKILADDYERALDASRSVKEWFVSRVESERERDINSKVWPYKTLKVP